MDGAHASPDIEQDGALDPLVPDDVDQLLRRAMQAPAAPSHKVFLCIAAVVTEERQIFITAKSGGPAASHGPMVRVTSSRGPAAFASGDFPALQR